jgi:hypothetical protein
MGEEGRRAGPPNSLGAKDETKRSTPQLITLAAMIETAAPVIVPRTMVGIPNIMTGIL